MADLELDPNTHDLVLRRFDLALVDGGALIVQRIKQRLLLFLGEWYLDTEAGVPWFQEILVKGVDLARVETLLKRAIVGTDGVARLTSLDLDFTPEPRRLLVSFRAVGENGEDLVVEGFEL